MPDSTNNSYYLQFDGGCAIDVGDSVSAPVKTWTWVNYQDGNTAAISSISLSAGSHQLLMTGREPGVGVDRVLLLSDPNCVPTGTGDNCTPVPDTTPPTVSLTAPVNSATVSGTTTVSASASDNVGVTSVQFKLDGANLGSPFTATPYSFGWDTTQVSNGTHTLTATASDGAGNTATAANVTITVNNVTQALPSVPTGLTIQPGNQQNILSWNANPTTDNITHYNVTNVSAGVIGTPATPSFTHSGLTNGQQYCYTVSAVNAAGQSAQSAQICGTPTAPDQTPPTVSITAPASVSTVSGTTTVSANASDNVGVTGVQFKLDGNLLGNRLTSAPYTYAWDTTKVANGNHTLVALASDAAGNTTTSTSVIVNVNNSIGDTTPPTQPTNVTATAASSSQVNLSWSPSTDNVGVVGYRVYRSTASGSFNLINTVSITGPATIGKTNIGGSCDPASADYKRVNPYKLSTGATINQLTVYLKPTGTIGSQPIEAVIYSDSSGSPNALLATSQPMTFTNTTSAGWYNFNFASAPSLTAGNYWFGIITGPTTGVASFCYDLAATNVRRANNNAYSSGPSSPFGTATSDTKQMSIYTSYNGPGTYGDTGLASGTKYSYYVVAIDAAGNASSPSATVTATTQSSSTLATLEGTATNSTDGAPINGAYIHTGSGATANGTESTYTNSLGQYVLVNLDTKSRHHYYYAASGFLSQTYYIQLPAGINIKNISMVP